MVISSRFGAAEAPVDVLVQSAVPVASDVVVSLFALEADAVEDGLLLPLSLMASIGTVEALMVYLSGTNQERDAV